MTPPRLHLPVWPFHAAGAVCEAVCAPLGIEPPLYRRRVDFFTKSRAFDISRARGRTGVQPAGRAARGDPPHARVVSGGGVGLKRAAGQRAAGIGNQRTELAAEAEPTRINIYMPTSPAPRINSSTAAGRRGRSTWIWLSAGRDGARSCGTSSSRCSSQHVPGALGYFLRKALYPSLLGACGRERDLRPQRRAAASAQDPHRRQRRDRRQLPARRQGRHQSRHSHRQRRVHRPQHDPVVQERRHRRSRTARTSGSTASCSRPARCVSGATRCWPPTAT